MKTTLVKTLMTLLGLVMLFTNLSAQSDTNKAKKQWCDYDIRKSQYIFEGKLISSKYLHLKSGEYTFANFNSYKIDVQRVIKGDIQSDTIIIIEPTDGIVEDKDGITTQKHTFDQPQANIPNGPALYFCYDAGNYAIISGALNTNAKLLKFCDGVSISDNKISGDRIGKYFSTLTELYNYLSANYDVKIPPADTIKQK